VRVSG